MANYSKYTDHELFLSVKEGNQKAFAAIYERYWGLLFVHSRKMLGDEDAAKDIVQDLFTDLLSKASDLQINTSLKSYLYSAVRYRTLDAMRKTVVRDNYYTSMVNFSEEFAPAADADFRYRELLKNLEAEISQLPPRMREIFVKSRMEGQSPTEISREFKISLQAVHKSIARAVETLGSKLFILIVTGISFLLAWLS